MFPYLALLLVLFTLPASGQEYGPRTVPRTFTIRGTVTDPALLTDGDYIQLSYLPWDGIRSDQLRGEVATDGTFEFILEDNTIRQYHLVVADQWLPFLAKPGEVIDLRIEAPEGEPRLFAQPESFTQQSIDFAREVLDFDAWPRLPTMEPGMDTEAYLAALPAAERDINERFERIAAEQGVTDEYLLSWGRQFAAYKLYHDATALAFMAPPGPGKDKTLLALTFPDKPRTLEELPVYADGYLLYVGDQQKRLEAMVRTLPRSTDPEVNYFRRDSILSSWSTGFTRDYLEALLIKKYIDIKFDDPAALAAAANFIEGREYPALAAAVTPEYIFATAPPERGSGIQTIVNLPVDTSGLFRAVLAEHPGEVVVIDLWATWCGPCKVQFRDLYPALIPEYADRPVTFFFASVDANAEAWEAYVASLPFAAKHTLLSNDQQAILRREYRVTGYPYQLVYRPDGTLAFSGHLAGQAEFIKEIAAAGEK